MMRQKLITYFLCLLIFSSCDEYFLQIEPDDETQTTQDVSGTPADFSQSIYESSNLSDLCDDDVCESDYETIPESFKEIYDEDEPNICAFDYDPNETSQILVTKEPNGVNGLNLLFSKEDLFFLAWASMRYQINPHFLMGVMAQESYGNCAAVSSADAEGCFQITNYYGRLQLQQSYAERVLNWYWNDSPNGYYDDSIFIDPLTWFGEDPETDQLRMTLDPSSSIVLGTDVSSVVNFNFGVIGSAMYYFWEQYFLYYNYSSTRGTTTNLIDNFDEEKASLMAAAYNGGIGSLVNNLKKFGNNYLDGMPTETQDYVPNVLSYCEGFQNGSDKYTTTYYSEEIDYIIDLLSYTYDESLGIDWEGLKAEIQENFFATEDDKLSFVDDVKALIYFISTYDPALAPVWPEDIND